jgi:hypothetical protein
MFLMGSMVISPFLVLISWGAADMLNRPEAAPIR